MAAHHAPEWRSPERAKGRMAPLKAILSAEEHGKLSDAIKALYSANGDAFKLDVESVDGWALDNIAGLQSAHNKGKETVRELKAKLAAFDGLDIDAARDALERVKSYEAGEGKSKERESAALKNQAETFEKERAKLKAENDSLISQLQSTLVKNAATLAMSKGEVEDIELLEPHVAGALRAVRGDDGKFALRVFNPDGSEALSKMSGRSAEPMSADELVGTVLKAKFPRAYKGTSASGSGANGSSGRGGPAGKFSLSRQEARDPQRYQAVRAEAEKAGQTVTLTD